MRRPLRRAVVAGGVARAGLDARAALGDLDRHEREHLARLFDGRAARGLDGFDERRRAAGARDDDVAGDVREVDLAGGADVDAARDALGLGLALVGAPLALLCEGGRGRRDPGPDSGDEREEDQ